MTRAVDLAAALTSILEDLCAALDLGAFTRAGDQIRFRSKGSLAVWIAGSSRGRFSDFETDQHGDALDLVRHIRGGSMADAMRWAEAFTGSPQRPLEGPPAREKAKPHPTLQETANARCSASDAAKTQRALTVWDAAKPIEGTLGEAYLHNRGCFTGLEWAALETVVRFHPATPWETGTRPCLLALMRDPVTARPVGIQRTPIAPDGLRADARRMLGKAGASYLTQDRAGGAAVLVEGLEDGLRVLKAWPGCAVWVAHSAGLMARFPAPAFHTRELFIMADGDQAGRKAAEACTALWRAAGLRISAFLSPPGRDPGDTLPDGEGA
jgi:putative DNA primase/helicase